MKLMKKIFVIMSMLFVGLSCDKVSSTNIATEVEAEVAGSYATLMSGGDSGTTTYYRCPISPLIKKITDSGLGIKNIENLVITTNASFLKNDPIAGCPIDVGSDSSKQTNGCHVAAYFYPVEGSTTSFDAVFYADVERIYAPEDCSYLFAGGTYMDKAFKTGNCLQFVKSITFDNFDTSRTMRMDYMFAGLVSLSAINGLDTFNTENVTSSEYMFVVCRALKELNLSSFDFSSHATQNIIMTLRGISDRYELGNESPAENATADECALRIIYLPKNLSTCSLALPSYFSEAGYDRITSEDFPVPGSVIAYSMQRYEDVENNQYYDLTWLANSIVALNTCTDYVEIPQYRAVYNQLSEDDKTIFHQLIDHQDNVLLMDKLLYMEYLMEADDISTELKSHYALSFETSQYLVMGIVGFSLMIIVAYYFVQKKKYVR